MVKEPAYSTPSAARAAPRLRPGVAGDPGEQRMRRRETQTLDMVQMIT